MAHGIVYLGLGLVLSIAALVGYAIEGRWIEPVLAFVLVAVPLMVLGVRSLRARRRG